MTKPDRIDVESESGWLDAVGIVATIAAIVVLIFVLGTIDKRVSRLQNQVACLEHPRPHRAGC